MFSLWHWIVLGAVLLPAAVWVALLFMTKTPKVMRAKAIAAGTAGLLFGGFMLLGFSTEFLRRQADGKTEIDASDLFVLAFAFTLLFLGLRSIWRGLRAKREPVGPFVSPASISSTVDPASLSFDINQQRLFPQAQAPRAAPIHETPVSGIKRNYFSRHWRGELSLPVSYWLNGILLNVVLLAVAGALNSAIDGTLQPKVIWASSVTIWTLIVVGTVWQVIGTWRSATQSPSRGGSHFWAGAAKVMMVLAVIANVGVIGNNAIPQLTEATKMAFGQDPVGKYSLRLLRGGGELEVSGGIAFGLTEDVRRLVEASDVKTIRLNSPGGRIAEARALRELIQQRGIRTHTATGCSSACLIAFMAGSERSVDRDARLGFHRYVSPGVDDKEIKASIDIDRREWQKLGVPVSFLDKAFATPSDQLWTPSMQELYDARVITSVSSAGDVLISGVESNSASVDKNGAIAPPFISLDIGERERLAEAVKVALAAARVDPRPPARRFDKLEERVAYLAWVAEMSERLGNKVGDYSARVEFLKTLDYEATRAGLNRQLLLALINELSDFRKYATHTSGSRGLMLIRPYWTRLIGDGDSRQLYSMRINLRYGTVILRHYLDKRNGDLFIALNDFANDAYVRPPDTQTAEFPDRVLAHWKNRWSYEPASHSGPSDVVVSSKSDRANVTTRFGTLSTNEDNVLLFRGKPAKPEIQGNNSLSFVKKFQFGDADVVLLQNNGGTACPAQYHFLTVTTSGLTASSLFGSCSDDLVEVSEQSDQIRVSMPGFMGPFESEVAKADAAKKRRVFVYRNGAVTEKGSR